MFKHIYAEAVDPLKKSLVVVVPWIEKYRPTDIEDIIGNENVIDKLKKILKSGNVPNMVICGPPGSGKTTSIMCIAKQILGKNYKDGLLELNASDERGIDTVRHTIKMFCKKNVSLGNSSAHKLVLLDEADNMTPNAQQALRRVIEIYSSKTRFLFACNTSSRIIEAIQSRCITLKFKKLTDSQIRQRLISILQNEQVKYTNAGLDAIISISNGDMRQVLNNAQAVAVTHNTVTENTVFQICDKPSPMVMKQVYQMCTDGNLVGAEGIVSRLLKDGYSSVDIIDSLYNAAKKNQTTNAEVIYYIAQTYTSLVKGCDTPLIMRGLLADICLQNVTH